METTKIKQTINPAGNQPTKKFRAGPISATVWSNAGIGKDGQLASYNTISIGRSYKDKDGKWQSTNSLRVNDLPKAAVVLGKAYEYLVLKAENTAESACAAESA